MEQPQQSPRFLAALSAALLPVVFFYAVLLRNMRNVPQLDDYPLFLGFITTLRQTETLHAKLLLFLTTQHFEYKLILPEAIAAAQCALFGHVNFSFLILLGNLASLGILWLYWKNAFPSETHLLRRVLLLLPVCYLLFSLNYAEAVNLAEFGLQIGASIFFAFVAIHFLIRPSNRDLALACLFALLAVFSNANGFLLVIVGLPALASRRKAVHFLAWIVTFALALAVYLFHYVPVVMAANGIHRPLFEKLFYLLSFLGAATENMSRFPIKGGAIVIGALVLLLFLDACRTRFYRRQPFVFYATLWTILTAVVVAQGRSGMGITLSLSLRYKIFSDLLLIFCYVYAVNRFDTPAAHPSRKRSLYAAAVTISVLFSLFSDYFGYRFLTNRQHRVEFGIDQFAADPAHNPPMVSLTADPLPPPEPEICRGILNRAIAAGIYTLPPATRR
jgi:hypothetical protein